MTVRPSTISVIATVCLWMTSGHAFAAPFDAGGDVSLWLVLTALALTGGLIWLQKPHPPQPSPTLLANSVSKLSSGGAPESSNPTPDNAAANVAHIALDSLQLPVIAAGETLRIEFINAAAEALLGLKADDARGRMLGDVLKLRDISSGETVDFDVIRIKGHEHLHALNRFYVLSCADGTETRVHCSITPIVNANAMRGGVVVTLRDQSHASLHLSDGRASPNHIDALTQLPSRSGFEHALKKLLAQTRGTDVWHSLCYIDLDNFKIINDTAGHSAGDALLQQLTEVLRGQVRTSDVVARLGGDEFALLLENCPLEQGQKVGEKVRRKIAEHRFMWQERPYAISASIGIVEISPDNSDIDNIMSTADIACFAAKDLGRNRVHVYLENDSESARRHIEMQWYTRITQAHSENRFTLYHQRIAPLGAESGGEHFEILVRMLDEKGEIVPPGAFLPAAERYNLMPLIDRWVINETFAIVKRRYDLTRIYPETVAINLSGGSLSDASLLDYIKQQFALHWIPPHVICFEITETAAISNITHAISFIKELKQMGCRFSLDDFGSGLSSFTYLKNMPVDYLKIDGSFVKNMMNDNVDMAMVQSINQLGHVMGIKTIAEFVENSALAEKLKALGVDYAQGYGIEKPRPFTAAEAA